MGWNSTFLKHSIVRSLKKVSIPNGMEFYNTRVWLNMVSIPNGMEFYVIRWLDNDGDVGFNSQWDGILQFNTGDNTVQVERFNSQWDGILLQEKISKDFPRMVSIPNGMEFYTAFLCSTFFLGVSIPNGMEFYPNISQS